MSNKKHTLIGVDIQGAVYYDSEQSLTDDQKQQSRNNIGAASDSESTETSAGLMSATNHTKLNKIEDEATKNSITIKTWTSSDMT